MSTIEHAYPLSLISPFRCDDCPRCGGLMVPEVFPELDFHWANDAAKRCVQCGEIVDPVIMKNRIMKNRLCRPGEADTERGVQLWHL